MTNTHQFFIACGMYAFTPGLQAAWQQLFDAFLEMEPDSASIRSNLAFVHDFESLRDARLLIGHTCGYPLMTQLRDDLVPFCVPLFDVPGTRAVQYSSRFIVRRDSGLQSLADTAGQVVAMNNADSNSGMNVLRHAISEIAGGNAFFSQVLETGGHLHSIHAVSEGRAALAAIDCVSYQLIEDEWPQLTASLHTIGYSTSTTGLPLVLPGTRYSARNAARYIDQLTCSLEQLSPHMRSTLHLSGFEAVELEDYQSILSLEETAKKRGYPELR